MQEISHLVGFCGEQHPSLLTFIFGHAEINQLAYTIIANGRERIGNFKIVKNGRKRCKITNHPTGSENIPQG